MPQAVADIVKHLSNLPPFPKVTTRLLDLLEDPAVSVDELASVISADPSLVIKVIHLSNSPFYMVSRPIESVRNAVFVLGISTIKSITTAVSIQKGLSSLNPRKDIFNMDDFWKHSYGTAIVASKLGKKIDERLGDQMYLVGLIHDIGKIIQACYWPETWKSAIHYLSAGAGQFESIEGQLFSWTHLQISRTLCSNWRFPDDILQHLGYLADGLQNVEDESQESLLSRANRIASEAGFRFPVQETYEDTISMTDRYSDLMTALDSEVNYQLRVLGD